MFAGSILIIIASFSILHLENKNISSNKDNVPIENNERIIWDSIFIPSIITFAKRNGDIFNGIRINDKTLPFQMCSKKL